MKQTAVEWLYHELDNVLPELYSHEWDKYKIAIQQAKEMEKEQIKDAYKQGTCHHGDGYTATEYYEDTFNTK